MACRLETERLLLRPPEAEDVRFIAPLIGDYDVAKNLSRVPHPYRESDAATWVSTLGERHAKGEAFQFAVTRKSDGAYMGGCGMHLDNGLFELGYWLGKPYWKMGYATEAARKMAGFAFHTLKVERLVAGWFHDNPASGHVLEKVGFVADGTDQRNCLARGHAVNCNKVVLDRENFGRRKAAA